MNKKKVIGYTLSLIAFLLICAAVSVLFMLSALPKDVDAFVINLGCTEFKEERSEIIKPFGELTFSANLNDGLPGVFDLFKKVSFGYYKTEFDKLKLKETEARPTDAEYLEIYFSRPDGKTGEKVFLYDFYQGKYYCLEDGKYYEVRNPKKLNGLFYKAVKTFGFDEDGLDANWRGQSTYSHEEFTFDGKDHVFESPTFRNDVPWSLKEKLKENERYDYRSSGFKNTEKTAVTTSEEAIALAAKELSFENPYGFTYYDKTGGFWLVELYDDKGYPKEKTTEYYHLLFDEVMTVVIDSEGKTLEVYQALTACRQFLFQSLAEEE